MLLVHHQSSEVIIRERSDFMSRLRLCVLVIYAKQMGEFKVMSIKQALQQWLNDPEVASRLSIETVRSIVKILTDCEEDFVILSNGGGQEFHIWFNTKPTKLLIKHIGTRIFAYRMNGVETICEANLRNQSWILRKYLLGENDAQTKTTATQSAHKREF